MPVVQVTGTNGKTTTARMIDELLRGFGLRVGRFTSPHLESMRERIVVDGRPISAERFVETYDDIAPYVQMVDAASDVPLSFFEVMVAMAYAAFAETPVDVAVVEVGMGGTWDATNVADARVAVVTPVALDHAEYLGPDVGHHRHREGRDHQAGAADRGRRPRPDVVAVLAHQPAGALEALVRRAVEVDATVAREGTEFGVLERRVAVGGQQIRIQGLGGEYPEVYLPLFGAHQAQNAAVALAAVEAFLGAGVGQRADRHEVVRAAFAAVRSPGRLERVRTSPSVLVDAAHNPAGMAATVAAVRESFDFTRLVGVVGVRARQGRRRHARRARAAVRRAGGHPEQLAAGDAGRRAGRPGRRRLRRRPGQRAPAAARRAGVGDRAGRGGHRPRPGRVGRAGHRQRGHRGGGPDPDGGEEVSAPRAADPARAAKALSGAAAATLLLEGIAVLFVPRGIVQSDGLGGGRLTVLLVLAVVLVLASGVQRRPPGC